MDLFQAFNHPPDPDVDTEPRPYEVYRCPGKIRNGFVWIEAPHHGIVCRDGCDIKTNKFRIAYSARGDKGPVVVALHGVPTNRRQWQPVLKRLAPFCRTIGFDMLGMGESDKPLKYGEGEETYHPGGKPWDWINDVDYIEQMFRQLVGDEKVIFLADDWGGGILSHFAAKYGSRRLHAIGYLDPISFDGYPVSEIQAFGRASAIEDDMEFAKAMGAADQTMVQIFKTMVHHPDKVYNQYSLRTIKFPYIDVDYERAPGPDNKWRGADSMTLRLHLNALRVLADRAAILGPAQLQPKSGCNPLGVDYGKIDVPVLVMWGDLDNMMPANQRHRFKYACYNTSVQIQRIPSAGHFAAVDKPNWVAESILNFITDRFGIKSLADVFMGFDGIWKGDEHLFIEDIRALFEI